MFNWFSKQENLTDDEVKYLRLLMNSFIINNEDKNGIGNVYLSPATDANVIFDFGDYNYIFPNNKPKVGEILRVKSIEGKNVFLEFCF